MNCAIFLFPRFSRSIARLPFGCIPPVPDGGRQQFVGRQVEAALDAREHRLGAAVVASAHRGGDTTDEDGQRRVPERGTARRFPVLRGRRQVRNTVEDWSGHVRVIHTAVVRYTATAAANSRHFITRVHVLRIHTNRVPPTLGENVCFQGVLVALTPPRDHVLLAAPSRIFYRLFFFYVRLSKIVNKLVLFISSRMFFLQKY